MGFGIVGAVDRKNQFVLVDFASNRPTISLGLWASEILPFLLGDVVTDHGLWTLHRESNLVIWREDDKPQVEFEITDEEIVRLEKELLDVLREFEKDAFRKLQ